MKIAKIIFIFTLLFSSIICFGQNKKDCKKLLKKEISVESILLDVDNFSRNFKLLIDCEFEPIDYVIFSGPKQDNQFLFTLLAMQLMDSPNAKLTYNKLKEYILAFKQSSEYLELRNMLETIDAFMSQEITLDNWEADSLLFISLNYQPVSISKIKELIMLDNGKHATYLDLINNYKTEIFPEKKEEKDLKTLNESSIRRLNMLNDYELGKQKSKEENKALLLYFTGYTCANAREIEDKVLTNKDIQDFINSKYIFVQLFVDDRTPLFEDEIRYSEILERELNTKGDLLMELQMKELGSLFVPLFILFDKNGNELRRMGFTRDKQEFWDFLAGEK